MASVLAELENALDAKNRLSPEQHLQAAQKAAERAVFLNRNLRYFSGNGNPERRQTDLSQLVLDAISQIEPELNRRNIQLEVRLEHSLYALVDTVAFEHAILSVLWFGAHQMPEGGKAFLTLHYSSRGIQLAFTENSHSSNASDSSSAHKLCSLDTLVADNMSVLGLHVARLITESHSGQFRCLKTSQNFTQVFLEFPAEAKLNKPHLYQEKRRFQRVMVNLNAEAHFKGQPKQRVKILVLSVGGAFIAMSQGAVERLNTGDTLSLQILTESGSVIQVPMARVANTHPMGENSGVGVEFTEVDPKGKNLLAALVRTHAS